MIVSGQLHVLALDAVRAAECRVVLRHPDPQGRLGPSDRDEEGKRVAWRVAERTQAPRRFPIETDLPRSP